MEKKGLLQLFISNGHLPLSGLWLDHVTKRMRYNVCIQKVLDYMLIKFKMLKTIFKSHHYFILYIQI